MPYYAVNPESHAVENRDTEIVYWLTRRDIRECLERYLDGKDEGEVPHAPVTEEQLDEVIDRFTDCDMSERPSWLDVVEICYKELYEEV